MDVQYESIVLTVQLSSAPLTLILIYILYHFFPELKLYKHRNMELLSFQLDR